MLHLIDTYIQADEPRKIPPFYSLSLLDLVVKTDIAGCDCGATWRVEGQQGGDCRDHREQRPPQDHQGATDRSGLLRKYVGPAGRNHRRPEGESHRVRGRSEAIAELAKQVEAGQADDTPETLKKSPALRALYNNLQQGGDKIEGMFKERGDYIYVVPGDPALNLALKIDAAVKQVRPDDWRDNGGPESR